MFLTNMKVIYKRLSILGLFLMCLFVFGYSDKIESVQAALLCAQDCDRYWEMCNDSCQGACLEDSTDEACNSCLTNCSSEWNYCLEHSTYCSSGTISYSPECQSDYGLHCPVINGQTNCEFSAGAHQGPYQICTKTSGQCVACPDHSICIGANGLPPCF